jgi:hypothetical protein
MNHRSIAGMSNLQAHNQTADFQEISARTPKKEEQKLHSV